MRNNTFLALIAGTTASLAFLGCMASAPYNQYSFEETARLKVESIALLQGAREGYEIHALQAESVMAGVNRAYQDANLRWQNAESMRQWEVILDPQQGSLAGILRQWKEGDTLSAAAIKASGKLIASNFDRISKLEGRKGR